jgi:hypothetical protein
LSMVPHDCVQLWPVEDRGLDQPLGALLQVSLRALEGGLRAPRLLRCAEVTILIFSPRTAWTLHDLVAVLGWGDVPGADGMRKERDMQSHGLNFLCLSAT